MTVMTLRVSLLEWVNDVLDLQSNKTDHYTKIEQLGTGVAYCYIIDTIYGDVQLSKLKINTKHERAYIHNLNVLKRAFIKHKIDKDIPVDRLVKCKFQDNLEFLHWLKLFWDEKHTGKSEDVTAKHQKALGLVSDPSVSTATINTNTNTNININTSNDDNMNGSVALLSFSSSTSVTQPRPVSNKTTELNEKISQLEGTINLLQEENQHYFNQLESIKHAILKSHTLKYNKPGSLINTLKKIDNIVFNEKDDSE